MQQNELKTPFGKIHMCQNGQRIHFEVEPFDYGMYLSDNTFKRPQGLYKLYPNIDELKKDDIIICEFDDGKLEYDGGDACTTNIVGIYQGYTIGMGTLDSDDIEEYSRSGERILPYENLGKTEKGFEIHMVDSSARYAWDAEWKRLCFIVAWEPGTTDEAWDVVSFVTC